MRKINTTSFWNRGPPPPPTWQSSKTMQVWGFHFQTVKLCQSFWIKPQVAIWQMQFLAVRTKSKDEHTRYCSYDLPSTETFFRPPTSTVCLPSPEYKGNTAIFCINNKPGCPWSFCRWRTEDSHVITLQKGSTKPKPSRFMSSHFQRSITRKYLHYRFHIEEPTAVASATIHLRRCKRTLLGTKRKNTCRHPHKHTYQLPTQNNKERKNEKDREPNCYNYNHPLNEYKSCNNNYKLFNADSGKNFTTNHFAGDKVSRLVPLGVIQLLHMFGE